MHQRGANVNAYIVFSISLDARVASRVLFFQRLERVGHWIDRFGAASVAFRGV